MLRIALAVVFSLGCVVTAHAQHPEPPAPTPPGRLILPPLSTESALEVPIWLPPDPRRFGVLTLLPQQKRGEIVRFSLPVGEFASRGVRAIGKAQRRRAERKAREGVQRELQDFLARQP